MDHLTKLRRKIELRDLLADRFGIESDERIVNDILDNLGFGVSISLDELFDRYIEEKNRWI